MAFFISEISSNHSSDLSRIEEFIYVSKKIGCDAVKFQLFKIDKLFAPEVLKKSDKHRNRKNWELPIEFIPEIASLCKKYDIEFGCSPFYIEAVEELKSYVDFFKIASYELLWDSLLIECAQSLKPVIISTGMATIKEIKNAVEILSVNNCKPKILHCTSAYPTPFSEANLAAIRTIRNATNCQVGWSDHTTHPGVIYRAISKWDAKIIEFHLDLDGKGEEYQTGHCWLPNEIEPVIRYSKESLMADGDGIKLPVQSEANDRLWRTDPTDGLRPFKKIRKSFCSEN